MACAPQRFLANNRNAVRTATLDPSSVLPVENSVLRSKSPPPRTGTAQVNLIGSYTGAEDATYDVEILDNDVETALISARNFSGEGTGILEDIEADAVAQEITVELARSGLPLLSASIDFEGATIEAREGGAPGNDIFIDVDQTGLTFTPQAFSVLHDLTSGSGGTDSPFKGSEFDYNTAIIGADGAIPLSAHRISFGTDKAVYIQYKEYKDDDWSYFLVPALKRDVPAGTVINFVTGGRSVTVSDGATTETYSDIVTLFDLLDALKTESALLNVTSPVSNDRTPEGQAARDLQTRTDAYYQPSSGSGGSASGFEDISVEPDAGTQLVIATCQAVSSKDHPLAGVGRERWNLKSSLLGDLGTIVTDALFEGAEFSLRIPTRLPYNFGVQKGRFDVIDIRRVDRDAGEENEPPICPVGLELGPDAVDQTITLTWTKRPSGACLCNDMPIPGVNPECLGTDIEDGGATMAYSVDARTRLEDLYDWAEEIVKACTRYVSGYVFDGVPEAQTTMALSALTGAHTTPGEGGVAASGTGTATRNFPDDVTLETAGHGDVAVPPNFQECIDFYENGISQIDTVIDSADKTAGFTQWDAALQEFKDDLGGSSPTFDRLATIATGKYKIMVKRAMAYAGLPQLGGADASTESGDGCWRDLGGDFWEVVGSDKGGYAPAFNNARYYSSRRASVADAYFSTHEFSFVINIKCPSKLKYGDQIVLAIGDAGWPATYQVGDELTLPIVGAAPLFLAGGQDASLIELWYVNGSVSGPFPTYSYDPDAPAPYSTGSPSFLSFTLVPGGIPFAKGDRFAFTIEGGHWRWRKNAGAWSSSSPAEPIPQGAVAFDEGLFIEFLPGAAPSFVAGDVFSFQALQPWAASNLQTPSIEPWKWEGSSATMVFALGSPTPMDMLSLWHSLPEGATITVEGGDSPGVYDWIETLTWRPTLIAHLLVETLSPAYLRLSVSGATDGAVIWFWAGVGLATEFSADVTPRRKYSLSRGDGGLYERGRYLGKGRGADVEWAEGLLLEDDMIALEAMIDWVKQHDDEPFVFVANITRPDEASLVQATEDEFEEHDTSDGNRNVVYDRRFDGRLALGAVLQ